MASVRKRILPRTGETRWQVDYRDQGGKRRAKQFITKAEAVSYETTIRTELRAGTHVPDSATVTLSEAGDLWIQRAETEGLEAGTIRQYRQHLKHHIKPHLGATKLSRLTKPVAEEFRDGLVEKLSRPLARAVLTSLKGILKDAQRRGLVGHNAAADTEIKLSKRGKVRVAIPTKDEIRAILTASAEVFPMTQVEVTRDREQKVTAVPWRPLLVTAIFTGLRCSELRGLAWGNVALSEGVIRVRERADFQNTIGEPKTEAGTRDVPLAPIVANTLRAWRLASPKTERDLVFPSESGAPRANSNIHKQCWGPIQRKLGLVRVAGRDDGGEPIEKPRYTFHALRHAAASLFIEQGWSPKKVQAVMGHGSIQVTFDTYGHLWDDFEGDAKAMAQIEARLIG